MEELVYFNGNYGKFSETKTYIEDRGYLFGDGIYEVTACYDGEPFRLDRHLKRLQNSAEGINLKLPWSMKEIENICLDVLDKSGIKDAFIYIQITRGTEPRNHTYSEGIKPNLIVGIKNRKDFSEKRKKGVKVILVEDVRWRKCWIKSTNLLPNILAKQRAKEQGALETIQYEKDGTVTEGGSSNVFAVYDGKIITPSLEHNILPGITREVVIEKAKKLGMPLEEGTIKVDELKKADEVFITSTAIEVMPVVQIEDERVGAGKPGEVALKLQSEFLK